MSHRCHAKGCLVEVPPKLVMCLRHWRMVPRDLQRAVWRHYRPGQEIDKCPTSEYMQAQQAAVEAVARIEARKIYEVWRREQEAPDNSV